MKAKNWSAYNLHYAPDGGTRTTAPGVQMEAACTDWVKKTVSLGGASGPATTSNNGSGVWDNNAGKNYAPGTGDITAKDGVVAHSDPCATDAFWPARKTSSAPTSPSTTRPYSSAWQPGPVLSASGALSPQPPWRGSPSWTCPPHRPGP
uniref:carbohydrate binding domain-containing protein n=1 Tax=Streptomyces atratus TaxID=1893 RepID=UPI003570A4E6